MTTCAPSLKSNIPWKRWFSFVRRLLPLHQNPGEIFNLPIDDSDSEEDLYLGEDSNSDTDQQQQQRRQQQRATPPGPVSVLYKSNTITSIRHSNKPCTFRTRLADMGFDAEEGEKEYIKDSRGEAYPRAAAAAAATKLTRSQRLVRRQCRRWRPHLLDPMCEEIDDDVDDEMAASLDCLVSDDDDDDDEDDDEGVVVNREDAGDDDASFSSYEGENEPGGDEWEDLGIRG